MGNGSAGRPSVTVHYAQTLDGRIATRTGQSRWISGDASLRLAHRLRAEHEAVLVGVGTVVADNPRLTVRLVPGRSPLRVVADSTLRLPLDAHVLVDAAARTLVATTRRASEERLSAVRRRGAGVLVVEEDARGRVDLAALLGQLRALGIASLLVEGGREVITSVFQAGLVDRLVVCIAPKIVGAGVEAVGDLGISHLGEALTFEETAVTRMGEDILFEGRPAPRPSALGREGEG